MKNVITPTIILLVFFGLVCVLGMSGFASQSNDAAYKFSDRCYAAGGWPFTDKNQAGHSICVFVQGRQLVGIWQK